MMTEEMDKEMIDVPVVQKGQIVSGVVSKIEDKQAIVDIGYLFEGILPMGEISNLHLELISDVLNIGDKIDLEVISINDESEQIILSKKNVDSVRAWEVLNKKFESAEIFQVKVADVVKGGLVVDLGVRAFIPASLIDKNYIEDLNDCKDKMIDVKIIEIDQEKNKVILSHKDIQLEEESKIKEELLNQLKIGEIIEGVVRRIADFGIFVNIGGVDGLVHVSELSWERVEKPEDVFKEGDKVNVKVLKIDLENQKIGLSIKETLINPWNKAIESFNIGDVYKGTVKRVTNFGAFVELSQYIEGLVHISQISNEHIINPNDVLKTGQVVDVKILDIISDTKRVSLSIREAEEYQLDELSKEFLDNKSLNVTLGDIFGDKLNNLK